jgi:outer membrane protein TolC
MKRSALAGLLACLLSGPVAAERLTLEEALAAVTEAHPDRRLAESDLTLALTERDQELSRTDFNLYLDGALRMGLRPSEFGGDWESNNEVRIVARKSLLDFGRSRESAAAAEQEVAARRTALINLDSLRRVDIMARYFDVLLADIQYAADNEAMAVAYVAWDNAQDRLELGEMTRPQMLELETRYQDIRERRNASLQRLQSSRQRLAHAINRTQLPAELVEPTLKDNDRRIPEYDVLLPWVTERNSQILILQAQLGAADSRMAAVRNENKPILEAEFVGADYSRLSTTRDDVSAGLLFTIPLYQGGRIDTRLAREQAQKEKVLAQIDKLRIDLAEALLETLQEIEWLRGSSRAAADRQVEYRDWALERARAEYELELKTNLGYSMAETQAAKLRRKQVEFRLALALARLEALAGGSLPSIEGANQ